MSTHATHKSRPPDGYQAVTTRDHSGLAIPLGLFELDAEGAVVRYSAPAEDSSAVLAEGILGRNFFTEVLPVEQVTGFRDRFHDFMASGQSVDRFTAKFTCGVRKVKVQIMMAHITERSEVGRRRLALVRVMPE
jgi:photoactive yellow protein